MIKKNQVFKYVISLAIIVVISTYIFKINTTKKINSEDLINISELSDEFMQDYFEGVEELQKNGNDENILIVTSLNGILDSFGATDIVTAPNNQYFLQYETEEDKEKALKKFQKDNSIISVGENIVYEIELDDSEKKGETLNNYSLENIEYNSWGIESMGLNHAFDEINNLSNNSLSDINVAIIDTGLDVDLFNKYYENKLFGTYNVLNNSLDENDMYDNNGHGTHIAGTIAEATSSNIKIIPVKVSDNESLSDVYVITAINYIVYYKKADVINMSFGAYAKDTELANAINSANSNNIICVAAAGNDNTSTTHYPSALDTTISVASVDSNLNKSSFSNYNDTVDFAAPGTAIKSIMGKNASISQKNGNSDDDDHETISGTSMAAPHVASAVAILKSFNKNLTINNIKDLLKKYSIDLGIDGKDKYFGYGFITFAQTTFCDNVSCDNYNVYKDTEEQINISKIEMENEGINYIYTNYGNITDLLQLKIKIYFNDSFYITKKLTDLEGLVIENYDVSFDKDQYGNVMPTKTQEITIRYRGKSTKATVMTYSAIGSSWKYEQIDENNIRITGFSTSVASNHPSTIYIPDTINDYNVLEIKDSAFKNDATLRKVFLPSTIKKIGTEAFYNDTNLSQISSFYSVEIIGDSAFKNTNLENVEFSESVISIGTSSFENTKISSLYIPKQVEYIGVGAFAGCNNLETIEVDDENGTYDSRNNSNAIIETSTNTLMKGIYNTDLPNDIDIIGEKAFYNDDRIEEINIPESVTKITYSAFAFDSSLIESKLEKVTILRNVTEIATNAFNNNNKSIKIYTYSDAVAKSYAISRRLSYETMNYSSITSYLDTNTFYAFDSLSGVLRLRANYNIGYYDYNTYYSDRTKIVDLFYDDISNLNSSQYQIEYIDNRDSFRYGDNYVTISGKDYYGNDFETQIFVLVRKATPSYQIPENLIAKVGQLLGEISLPNNFEWMDSTTVLSETGEQVFKARYIPTDKQNYKTVENIDIPISVVNDKTILIPNILISNKTYDGTANVDLSNILISNLNIDEYTIVSSELSNINVGDTTATLTLRLSDSKFQNYTFENGAQEKTFVVTAKIVPQQLTKPTLVEKEYTYNSEEQIVELNNFDSDKMDIIGNKRTNAGEQNVIISLKNSNYIWKDNTLEDIILNFVINKAEISIQDNTKNALYTYDNTPHSLVLDLGGGEFNIKYMDGNEHYTLNESPSYVDVGEYTIKYKVFIDENYTEYFGERTITILRAKYSVILYANNGTEDFVEQEIEDSVDTKLNKNTFSKEGYYFSGWNTNSDGSGDAYADEQIVSISDDLILYAIWQKAIDYEIHNYSVDEENKYISRIMVNTQLNTFTSNFILGYGYGIDVDYKEISNKQVLYTGGKTRITHGLNLYEEYTNVVIGDINGDGAINSADLLKVRQHLLGINILSGAYFISSDINYDNTINSADLLRVRQHLLGLKPIE